MKDGCEERDSTERGVEAPSQKTGRVRLGGRGRAVMKNVGESSLESSSVISPSLPLPFACSLPPSWKIFMPRRAWTSKRNRSTHAYLWACWTSEFSAAQLHLTNITAGCFTLIWLHQLLPSMLMVFITSVSFQHWLDVTKSIKKQVKSKFTKSRASAIYTYTWCVWSGSFFCVYFVTHSNMFWASLLLSLPVGPPYCLHLRVKFYSSEPNNLHEELTRSIKKRVWSLVFTVHTCFHKSVWYLSPCIHHETVTLKSVSSFFFFFRYLFVLQLKQDILSGKWVPFVP